jgi:hypothetical protein
MFRSGHVFVCTNNTVEECFSRSLFGAPISMWTEVSKIHNNHAIFLFRRTINHPVMYGVFLADGAPGLNLEPLAWGGKLPAQVRVKQYFKFSPIPFRTTKKIFEGNDKGTKIGLQTTAEQTLDLITKFILHTRIVLGHRVLSKLSGDVGKSINSDWVKEKWLLLHYSSNWFKKLISRDKLGYCFVPECMLQGGTIQDFVAAIRSTSTGERPQRRKSVISEDWKYFLKIISDLFFLNSYFGNSPDQMEDIISMLSQKSSPVWLPIGSPALKAAHAAAVKKWFGSSASNQSIVKKRNKPVRSKLLEVSSFRKMHKFRVSNEDQPKHRSSYSYQKQNVPISNNRTSCSMNHFANVELRRRRGKQKDVYKTLEPESETELLLGENEIFPFLSR